MKRRFTAKQLDSLNKLFLAYLEAVHEYVRAEHEEYNNQFGCPNCGDLYLPFGELLKFAKTGKLSPRE